MKFGQKAVTVLVALVIVVMFHNAGMAAELKWGNDLKKAAAAGISKDTLIERSKAFVRIAEEIGPHWLEEAR